MTLRNKIILAIGILSLVFSLSVVFGQSYVSKLYAKVFIAGDATDTFQGELRGNDGGTYPAAIQFLTSSAGIQLYTGDATASCLNVDIASNDNVFQVCATTITLDGTFTATSGGSFQGSTVEFTVDPGIKTDGIIEYTTDNGVDIDGVLLKDSLMSGTYLDINGLTGDATPDGAADYVITYDATAAGNKKVLLNNLPAAGGGEINTGSNQGTDGVGVYDTKVGVDLQFRHVAPGSTKITTTLNSKDIDVDADTSVLWNFTGAAGAGDYSVPDIDLAIGDVTTPDYGLARFGDAIFGRTSRVTGALDLDGTVVIVNRTAPSASNILFAMMDATNSIRFALPKSAVGNATYNPRSMLIAGPAPVDDTAVTVGYWQGTGIFDNIDCDTSGTGADLGIQDDLEVEGSVFVDTISESTSSTGVTIDGVLLKDNEVAGTYVGEASLTHDHDGVTGGGTVDHTDLSNIGTNTHAQIDTHIATANPHSGSAASGANTDITSLSSVSLTGTTDLGGNIDWSAQGMVLTSQTIDVGASTGDLVYFDGTDWNQADADAEASCSKMFGIYLGSNVVLTHGIRTTTGLTAGAIYYASTTAGGITTTAPSGSGDIVRVIGYALSTTQLFFDPDKTWLEVS